MPNKLRAGLFIYAKDLKRMSQFYQTLLGLSRVQDTGDLTVLESPDLQLLIHAIPHHIASSIVITSPPERREEAALKFFFPVASIATAREVAPTLEGEVFQQSWDEPAYRACNAVDPEGNVFQLRERVK